MERAPVARQSAGRVFTAGELEERLALAGIELHGRLDARAVIADLARLGVVASAAGDGWTLTEPGWRIVAGLADGVSG